MDLNNALLEIKEKIIQADIDIKKARSEQKKKQLLKYKHRLEKQVIAYMYYRYGIKMKRGN